MKTNKKELYLSPEVYIFEVKTEGVVCISGDINATMDGTFTEETLSVPSLGI